MESSLTAVKILHITASYSTYIGCLTFTAGIIGNVINILVFLHIKFFRNNQCIFYLTIETLSDVFHQLFSITMTILISFYGNDFSNTILIWCRLKYFLAQSFGLMTFSMICFEATDQYFSTNYRCILRQICTFKLAQCVTLVTVFLCFLHSLLCSFYVNIIPLIGCIIPNVIWIRYFSYIFYPVIVGFLPITIASLFSLLAFRNVRRIVRRQIPIERRRFDRQITAMILLRVMFFVIFTLPYIIYRIYIVNVPINQNDSTHYAIVQLIQAIIVSIVNLNYTGNFYIFILSSARYRRQVKYVLVKKCWKGWFSWNKNTIHPDIYMNYSSHIEME